MEWLNVQSSNIKRIGYDIQTHTLAIEFHDGNLYEYYNVPANVYRSFIIASSYGTYANKNIYNIYSQKKIR
jgi:hypothetical protein